jgi:hypothetical protein
MRPPSQNLAGSVSVWLFVSVAIGACGGGGQSAVDAGTDAPFGADTTAILEPDGGAGPDAPAPADASTGPDALSPADAIADAGSCSGPSTSTLDGVSLVFPPARCRFSQAEVAAGIEIPYEVVVARDLTGIQPLATDEGSCGQPGPSGLIVSFAVTGVGQNYCLCDLGLCGRPMTTTSPRTGRYPATIAWDGTNWRGPSDVPSPKGPPFPPDTYDVIVTAKGTRGEGEGFEVKATRTVTITADP